MAWDVRVGVQRVQRRSVEELLVHGGLSVSNYDLSILQR
jgi:hypothetical protein